MLEILIDITQGKGNDEDLELLQELAETVKDFSLCGLGQTAPNTVLSTLRYFRDEYDAHVRDKKCAAAICKALIEYVVIEEKCTGCGACLKQCCYEAIQGDHKKTHWIDPVKCTRCGICRDVCTFEAIMIK